MRSRFTSEVKGFAEFIWNMAQEKTFKATK
jgi:hypothetical protein